MKVTEIEVHVISLPYQDWLAYPLNHYSAPSRRTVYVAHTDTGLIGLGDGGGPVAEEMLDRYIGSNPFDWMGDELSLPLGMAMYDLMGHPPAALAPGAHRETRRSRAAPAPEPGALPRRPCAQRGRPGAHRAGPVSRGRW